MLRLALLTSLLCLAAFALLVASTPRWPPLQPIQFSHKLHLDYFQDGRHRQTMVSMHEERLLEELEDEEIVGPMIEMVEGGNCTLCHGDFDENVKNMARLGHCAECHRVALEHDWEGREDQRPCMGCHSTVAQSPRASIPNTNTCAACHPTPLEGDRRETRLVGHEETKLHEFIEQEKVISWVRVYDYLPGNIVFSHERHVELGRLKCQECHGPVERSDQLFLDVELSMEDCMSCHEASGAENDCLACHR